ncbi:uncharacterized protein METZ01_LOCUS415351, partial [marine metagenome]
VNVLTAIESYGPQVIIVIIALRMLIGGKFPKLAR